LCAITADEVLVEREETRPGIVLLI
jgi:hypothetical protein